MYADNNKISIGDTLKSDTQSWKVTGFIALPDYSCLFQNNNDSMFDSVKFGVAIVAPEEFETLDQEKLRGEQPEVVLLINNAGCGYLGNVGQTELASQTRMVDLNVRALTAITHMTVPYMGAGSRILNVSSIASFCPNPRLTVYSSTKAYVSSYTIGLAEELRSRKIGVTAVCPGPMKTEFLDVGGITGNSRMFEMLPYCDQVRVAGGALRAARAGRTIYTPRLFYKTYRLLAKLMPAEVLVKLVKT